MKIKIRIKGKVTIRLKRKCIFPQKCKKYMNKLCSQWLYSNSPNVVYQRLLSLNSRTSEQQQQPGHSRTFMFNVHIPWWECWLEFWTLPHPLKSLPLPQRPPGTRRPPLTTVKRFFCGEKWGFDSVGTANKEKFGFDQGKYLKPVAEFNQRQTQRDD